MRRVNQAIKERQQRFEKRLAVWIEREQSNAEQPSSDEQQHKYKSKADKELKTAIQADLDWDSDEEKR